MKITDELIYRYTCGDCWILALALNELTEWPLMLFGEWEDRRRAGRYEEVFMWNHAAVQSRPRFIVDIYGEQTAEKAAKPFVNMFYDGYYWRQFSYDEYMREMADHAPYSKYKYNHAKRVAKSIMSNMKVGQSV